VRFAAWVIAASLGIGLILGDELDVASEAWLAGGAVAALGALCAARRGRGLVGALAITWCCAGAALAIPESRAPPPPAVLARHGPPLRFEGRIVAPPARAYGRTRLTVDLARVGFENGWKEVAARARVSLGGLAHHLALGDWVAGAARFFPPRVLGNPGSADAARGLRYDGVGIAAFAASPQSVVRRVDGQAEGPWPILDRWRAALAARLGAGTLGEGPLVAAFFLGDRGGLRLADRDAFTVAGLNHILAVSGQHLAIIAFLLYRILGWLLARWEWLAVRLVPQRAAALATLLMATGYTLLVGAPNSALRALAMSAVYLGGILVGRASRRADALWLGAAAIAAVSPGALFDVGFQLSVLAVLGLLWVSPGVGRALGPRPDPFARLARPSGLRRWWKWAAAVTAATVGASVVTAPWVAHHFQIFTPLGLLGAFVVVPIMELWILPVSVLAAVLPPLSDGLWMAAEVGAVGLRLGLEVVTGLDALAVAVVPPRPLEVALLTALVLLLPLWRRRAVRWLAVGLALAYAISLGAGLVARYLGSSLRVTFLSVGHGDAAVVQIPGNHALLVDGGGALVGDYDVGREVVAPALRALGVTRLDAVVLSHPHPDHARGLAHVVRAFPVREFWHNGAPLERLAPELAASLRERALEPRTFRAGVRPIRLGPAELEIVHPLLPTDEPRAYYHELGENDNSLALAIRFGGFRALLPGDLEADGERVFLESTRRTPATLLKAPHHGSRTSSTAAFLEAIRPRCIVFSVGESNAFGFPHPEVWARGQAGGARLFRTDRDGAVEVTTDGEKLEIRTLRTGRRLGMRLP
jgi:competence protein ComEC